MVTLSGELLLQRFVDHLPEELHEEELDSSEGERIIIIIISSTGLGKTFIILYKMYCNKGIKRKVWPFLGGVTPVLD